MTGEGTCDVCGDRILVVREIATGKLVTLDARRTDGGWMPEADARGLVVAEYVAPGKRRTRDGHHAHTLRCQQARLEQSRERILHATTEPPRPVTMVTEWLPMLTPAGLHALVGASS